MLKITRDLAVLDEMDLVKDNFFKKKNIKRIN